MPSRQIDSAGTKVLLVMEDERAAEPLRGALTAHGFSVVLAARDEDALEALKEHAIDIVVCELDLGGEHTVGFTYKLCRMRPDAPIVLIAERDETGVIGSALDAGAYDFLIKPIDLTSLPLVLENNLLRKRSEMRRLHDERADVLLKTIRAIAIAIDTRSQCERRKYAHMPELCLQIGIRLGLTEESLRTLELAAYVHDLGKIGTPDWVLNKSGKLTSEEWRHVLKHPIIGADYFAEIDELAEITSIVRHHHEHFDGTGYPDGLKGEAIPISARIIGVADAFEAMTSGRPYKQAKTIEQALAELRSNAGTQFDPDVVAAAIDAQGTMEEIEAKREAA